MLGAGWDGRGTWCLALSSVSAPEVKDVCNYTKFQEASETFQKNREALRLPRRRLAMLHPAASVACGRPLGKSSREPWDYPHHRLSCKKGICDNSSSSHVHLHWAWPPGWYTGGDNFVSVISPENTQRDHKLLWPHLSLILFPFKEPSLLALSGHLLTKEKTNPPIHHRRPRGPSPRAPALPGLWGSFLWRSFPRLCRGDGISPMLLVRGHHHCWSPEAWNNYSSLFN